MIAHQYSLVHGKLERSNEDGIRDKYIYKLMPCGGIGMVICS
jgi:hypothetical protein